MAVVNIIRIPNLIILRHVSGKINYIFIMLNIIYKISDVKNPKAILNFEFFTSFRVQVYHIGFEIFNALF